MRFPLQSTTVALGGGGGTVAAEPGSELTLVSGRPVNTGGFTSSPLVVCVFGFDASVRLPGRRRRLAWRSFKLGFGKAPMVRAEALYTFNVARFSWMLSILFIFVM